MTNGQNSSPARILVLDDDAEQRDIVRLQLHGLGEIVEFGDPRPALTAIREEHFDVAVVDIWMEHLPVDGRWFLQELRQLESSPGIVIRTGDDSMDTALTAIDARAIQRVVKAGENEVQKLREAVTTAISESQSRRRTNGQLAAAEKLKRRYEETLSRVDDQITVGELCRGFVQGLTNHVAAVAGFSELLQEHPAAKDPELAEILQKLGAAAARLDEQVNGFLRTPFIDPSFSSPSINDCLDALQQIFRTHQLFTTRACTFEACGILPDSRFSADPNRLLVALRHLVEFCALRMMPVGGNIRATASYCKSPRVELARNRTGVTMNKEWAPAGECGVISISANCGHLTADTLRQAFRSTSEDPLTGNLFVLTTELLQDHLAFEVATSRRNGTTFSLYLPLAQRG